MDLTEAKRNLKTGIAARLLDQARFLPSFPNFLPRIAEELFLDVSTAKNGAVFYSGPGNRALAEDFAVANGRTTLEMTPGGSVVGPTAIVQHSSKRAHHRAG